MTVDPHQIREYIISVISDGANEERGKCRTLELTDV